MVIVKSVILISYSDYASVLLIGFFKSYADYTGIIRITKHDLLENNL